ncbi:MAG: alpha/beta hydrolase [Acidobacteriia bacterium]|nr:alpha/beta hydrolase [Terriglobia bacterium]
MDTVVIPNRIYLFEDFQGLAQSRTAIFYDPRNRGLSDTVTDEEKLVRGIHHDVDDLEAIRRHYGLDRMAILAHSYIGTAAILFAVAHPHRLSRLVLMGPMPPDPSTEYPAHLRSADGTLEAFYQRFSELRRRAAGLAPGDLCQESWALLRTLYVAAPEDSDRLHWAPCDVPNEVNFMQPFLKYIMPSLSAVRLTSETLAHVTAPVLIIHGRKDRSSPYGGGRDWARLLPNARLLTIDEAAHVPWIEAPETVYGAIDTFLDGAWPPGAEQCR